MKENDNLLCLYSKWREYKKALKELPEGCLAEKEIRGHKYYYLVRRFGSKVKYIYKGKLSKEEVNRHNEAKVLRAKYRKLLSQRFSGASIRRVSWMD